MTTHAKSRSSRLGEEAQHARGHSPRGCSGRAVHVEAQHRLELRGRVGLPGSKSLPRLTHVEAEQLLRVGGGLHVGSLGSREQRGDHAPQPAGYHPIGRRRAALVGVHTDSARARARAGAGVGAGVGCGCGSGAGAGACRRRALREDEEQGAIEAPRDRARTRAVRRAGESLERRMGVRVRVSSVDREQPRLHLVRVKVRARARARVGVVQAAPRLQHLPAKLLGREDQVVLDPERLELGLGVGLG